MNDELLACIRQTAKEDVPDLEHVMRREPPEIINLLLINVLETPLPAHYELIAMLMLNGADPYAPIAGQSAFDKLELVFDPDYMYFGFIAVLLNTRNLPVGGLPPMNVDDFLPNMDFTPLSFAVDRQLPYCVRWLLRGRGANPNLGFTQGRSTLYAMRIFQQASNTYFENFVSPIPPFSRRAHALTPEEYAEARRRCMDERDVAEHILCELISAGADTERYFYALSEEGHQYTIDFVRAQARGIARRPA